MTQRYEVQTRFIYGFENVWRDEDDKLIYFDTREQAIYNVNQNTIQGYLEHSYPNFFNVSSVKYTQNSPLSSSKRYINLRGIIKGPAISCFSSDSDCIFVNALCVAFLSIKVSELGFLFIVGLALTEEDSSTLLCSVFLSLPSFFSYTNFIQ